MNDIITLKLTAMAHGGSALGRYEKRVTFVPYTIPGERIQARLLDVKKRFAQAELVEILNPSSARTSPPCPYFGPGMCGGCHFQHIAYDHQLAFKQEVVVDQLQRLGKIKKPPVKPVVPSPDPWNYRVHATFTIDPDGLPAFYADDGQSLLPVDHCMLLRPELLEMLELLDFGAAGIERVRFQVGTDPEDRMVVLYSRDDDAPEVEVDLPVSVNLILSDNEPVNLIGHSHVSYEVFDRKFRVTAGGFFQANLPQAELLVDQVIKRLNLQGGETVLDLYSGVGLFTAFIAERAGLVMSVESYPPAVTDADQNLGDLENIELIEGPVENVLADLEGPVDSVVVDPPRTGLEPEAIKGIVALGPERIVYVSCDPATFARDARDLAKAGYRLIDVLPVDMFPQTYHIETVATLKR